MVSVIVSKVEVVVLGLLSEEPLHGYGLLERFRARGMGNWVEVGKASVYQSLRRLEQRGLLSGRAEAGAEGPDRRVFTVTKAGRDRLRMGLRERFAQPAPSEAALAIAFAHVLPAAEARRSIADREGVLRAMLDRTGPEPHQHSGHARMTGANWDAMLDRQQILIKAELAWLAGYKAGRGSSRGDRASSRVAGQPYD
jgi:DNA-binding PadR family transcriptional regulator